MRFNLTIVCTMLMTGLMATYAMAAPIHDAAAKGDLAKVKALLRTNPKFVSLADKNGAAPLHHAVAGGHKAIVELLLASKANVNGKKNDGVTPLHVAAALGRTEIAKLLYANGADPKAVDSKGRTPLSLAEMNGHTAIVELLTGSRAGVQTGDVRVNTNGAEAMALTGGAVDAATVTISPAPAGEELSKDFAVNVEGRDAPVYVARVAPGNQELRMKAMDDTVNSANYYEKAAFTTFDMRGAIQIIVTCPKPISSVRVLPSSLKIVPAVRGNSLTFGLAEPKLLTVEVNGDWVHSLHILANPPEENVPKKDDPNVIYFGPGIHEVGNMVVGSGKTVYIAGGAIVRGIIKPGEPHHIEAGTGLPTGYSPTFELRGKHITFRGRGILDGTGSTTHAKNLLYVNGRDISIEGIILRDSSVWNLPIRQSDRVSVKNLKIIGYRANSDGIDICNSRDVTVEDCFIRTLDDLVVIKTDAGQGKSKHIVVKDCVLWNEVAHALSIGGELREDVDDVLFSNCDVIHDKGREWMLRVFHCDSARITNVRFENLRIEESRRLISLWIGKNSATLDSERGHINGVTFSDIHATADPLWVDLQGFDGEHAVENVEFRDVVVNGRPLAKADVKANVFVRGVTVRP